MYMCFKEILPFLLETFSEGNENFGYLDLTLW